MKPILFLKSLVAGYTRKDGTVVKPHSDRRTKRQQAAPGQMALFDDEKKLPPNRFKGADPVATTPDMFDTVTEPRSELIAEHKRLVQVLNSPSHADDKAEAKKQEAELAEYEGGKTETPAFRKWFGDSKVVDAEGNPLVVYHGTNQDFVEFKNRYAKKGWEMFSTDPNYSNTFAGNRGGNVMPVYLSIRNPLDLSHIPAKGPGVRDMLIRALEDAGVKFKIGDIEVQRELFQMVNMAGHKTDLSEAVQAAGFDGIKMPDVLDNMAPYGSASDDLYATTYIAFRPEQIKSATGNNGDYSSHPDITKSIIFLKARP